MNAAALLGAFAVTCVALVAFSLAPLSILSRVDLQGALRGARETTGRRSRLTTEAMVAAQIVLAVVVLSAAGLIVRSLVKLERADLAIDPARILIGELSFRADLVDGKEKQLALIERIFAEVRALPGVAAASPVLAVPFSGNSGFDGRLARDGQSEEEAGRNPIINLEVVAPEYFATFGLAPVRGRAHLRRRPRGRPACRGAQRDRGTESLERRRPHRQAGAHGRRAGRRPQSSASCRTRATAICGLRVPASTSRCGSRPSRSRP